MKQQSEPSRLRQFIAAEALDLRATLRHYLLRAGLGNRGQSLDSAAGELLNEIVVEALAHESRFKPTSSPRAWLLGIGANLIKRRQTELAKQQRREPLIRDLYPATEDAMSDDEIFDVVLNHRDMLAGQGGQHADQLLALLKTLSVNDQQIVRLAMQHNFNGEALAHELGVSPGTARVRLHRALQRLRGAYETQEMTHDEA